MAIQRNAATGQGNSIREPGEYRVKVAELTTGLSKAGKAMLTVTFQTADERKIRAYFVRELAFHMKALAEVKVAAGLKADAAAENLMGREIGILVEAGEPNPENGRVFMQIVGYGPASEVAQAQNEMPPAGQGLGASYPHGDGIPF